MLICQILERTNPDVLQKLCSEFGIDLHDSLPFVTETDLGYFDPAYEMTHDSEGRYLDYTRGRR